MLVLFVSLISVLLSK